MTIDESRDTQISEKQTIIRRHTNNWEPESPKALVFDPSKPDNVTEEEANEQNSKCYLYTENHI